MNLTTPTKIALQKNLLCGAPKIGQNIGFRAQATNKLQNYIKVCLKTYNPHGNLQGFPWGLLCAENFPIGILEDYHGD